METVAGFAEGEVGAEALVVGGFEIVGDCEDQLAGERCERHCARLLVVCAVR